MSIRPLVSIIMPIYNSEKYLCDTLNSIINQTFEDFELILVNDGSSDSSPLLCEEYSKKDNRIQVIHIENNGPGNARNYGISLAKGEYIQFVDSDDIAEKDMVQKLLECMHIEKVDIVVCGVKKINVANHETIISLSTRNIHGNEIRKEFVHLLKHGLAYSTWNKLYKKSIIEKYKIKFNSKLMIGEDALFNIDYFSKCNRVSIIENPLYIYKQRIGSLTNKYYKEKEMAQILLYQKLIEYLGKDAETNLIKEANSYYLMEFSFIIYQNSIGIKNIKDFFRKARDTKKLTNSLEFNSVRKNSYPYSLIQRTVIILSKLKCESLLLLLFLYFKKFSNKVSN